MIEANFQKKRLWSIVCLICGLFLIGLFLFVGYQDSEGAFSDMLAGILMGAIICIFSIIGLLYNLKAFLIVDEQGHIRGRYHYFGKVDCQISDVDFVFGQINTLSIRLNDGKNHSIMGIENAGVVAAAIRQRMLFDRNQQPEVLIEQLKDLMAVRKKGIISVCVGMVLMFFNILVTVFLTGGRELHQFSKTDWSIFALMGVIEVVIVIIDFYLAQRTGQYNNPIEKLRYTIRRIVMETKTLMPGSVMKVYASPDYKGRLTMYRQKEGQGGYYIIQEFDRDFNLVNVYGADLFENIEQFQEGLENLIDITDEFL